MVFATVIDFPELVRKLLDKGQVTKLNCDYG